MNESQEDLPKMIAAIALMIPGLTLKTGWAYLRMRKRAQKVSKVVEQGMISNGMPPHMARQLAGEFANDVSIHTWIRSMNIPGFRSGGEKPAGK